MKRILFTALLIVCATAQAQTNMNDSLINDQLGNTNSMPESSRDNYLGIYLAELPKYQGSTEMKTELVMDLQQEWSNGIFASVQSSKPYDTYQLGKHISSVQNMDYGVMLGVGQNRASFITESDGNANKDWMPFVGGFFKYQLAEDIQLSSELLYYFGQFKGGAYADLNLTKSFALNEHQTLSLSVGTNLGNHDFTTTQFGISQQQSAGYGYPPYSPLAGVADVHGALNWRWNFNSAWSFDSSISASHLTNNVSGTSQVKNENNGALFVGFAYRY